MLSTVACAMLNFLSRFRDRSEVTITIIIIIAEIKTTAIVTPDIEYMINKLSR